MLHRSLITVFVLTVVLVPAPVLNQRTAMAASGYSSTVLGDSPTAYWRLGESSGTVAHDSSGHGWDGAIVGGVTPGAPGAIVGDPDTAMTFDGSTGMITTQLTLPTTSFSVEFWHNPSGFGRAALSRPFGSGDSATGGNGLDYFFTGSDSHIAMRDGGTVFDFTCGALPTLGEWEHVVVTVDSQAGAQCYRDGTLAGSNSVAAAISTGGLTVHLGSSGDGGANYTGSVDEAAVYPYPLTPAQVDNHFALSGRAKPRRPLVYVLGIGGSELKATSSQTRTFPNSQGGSTTVSYSAGDVVWLNGAWTVPGQQDKNDVLRFKSDGTPAFPDFAPGGGPVQFLGKGYPDVVNFFTGRGYTLGADFFVFTYDWRFDAARAAADLDNLVGQAAGGGQVDVIAHSMGTLVTRQFLLTGQNSAKVHKVALLAPPNLGTPHGAYGAMAGVDLTTAFFGINQTVARYILQTLPGALDQSPSAAYYSVYHNQDPQHPVPFADLTRTPNAMDYAALRQAEIASGVSQSAIAAAESLHASDLTWPGSLAGTDISLFSGTGFCTPGQVQLKVRRLPFGRRIPYYDFGEVDGDDTVSVGSSSMDGGAAGGASLPVYYRHATHTEMGDSPDVLADALSVVQGSTSVDHGTPGTATRCRSVSIHSPMEMMLTDPSGKRVGGLTAADAFMEAPHSTFWRFADMKVGTVDPGSPFTASLHGTAFGESMVKVRTWAASGLSDETVFPHVPTTPSTTGSFTFDGSSVSALRVDVLGDGSDVRQIQPTLLTGAALTDVTPPVIAITTPAPGQAVVGGFPLSWTASDTESGVGRSLAVVDLACGADDDSSEGCEASRRTALDRPRTVAMAPGHHTLDVWAEDRVENSATVHQDFVADAFAWLPPLAPGFTARAGQQIPVRFTVATPEGAFVGDQSVLVDLVDSSGQPVTPAMAFGADPSRNVVIQDEQYHTNLSTAGLAPGAYSIRVRFASSSLTGTMQLRVDLA